MVTRRCFFGFGALLLAVVIPSSPATASAETPTMEPPMILQKGDRVFTESQKAGLFGKGGVMAGRRPSGRRA